MLRLAVTLRKWDSAASALNASLGGRKKQCDMERQRKPTGSGQKGACVILILQPHSLSLMALLKEPKRGPARKGEMWLCRAQSQHHRAHQKVALEWRGSSLIIVCSLRYLDSQASC